MTALASWRLALRLARREAGRHRLRAFLTLVLVAVPVAGLVAAAVLVRSAQLPAAETDRRTFGAADALIYGPPEQLAGRLPAGTRTAEEVSGQRRVSRVDGAKPRLVVDVARVDYRDELLAGIVHQLAGRAPAAPGEVALTPALLDRLHLRLGDRMRLGGGTGPVLVVGTAQKPDELGRDRVFAFPGTVAPTPAPTAWTSSATDFSVTWIGLPRGAAVAATLERLGEPPALFVGLPTRSQPREALVAPRITASGVSTVALVVVLALLQSALTAGTAFAVGARRQRRDLALLAVNGGTDRHVSRVVLASGFLFGAAGAALGVLAGLVLAPLALPLLERYGHRELVGLRIDARLIAAAGLFGLISALLAALTPARLAARVPARAALLGLRGQTRTPRWVTTLGLVLLGGGLLVTVLGATSSAVSFAARTPVVLLGVVSVELGAVALCPVLVGAAGRLARLLPATPRLALRDAARQRARSGPAVAAVAAAVSGAVAVGVFVASTRAPQIAGSSPSVRAAAHVTLSRVSVPGDDLAGVSAAEARDLLRHLRVDDLAQDLPLDGFADPSVTGPVPYGGLVVGDAALLRVLGAPPSAAAELARVGAVVPDPALTAGGGVHVQTVSPDGAARRAAIVPAAVTSWAAAVHQPAAVLTAAAARAAGLTTGPPEWHARLADPLSPRALSALSAAAGEDGIDVAPYAVPPSRVDLATLALLGVAALVALLVTAVATVLAGTEARDDLAVLGAVGASPGVRRRFQAAQAAVTAVLGGAIGLAIGVVPAAAVVVTRAVPTPLVVPWQPFPLFLVALPVLAALGGALLTRSQLPGPVRRG